MELFNTVLSVKLTPTISHLNLAQAFAKAKGRLA